MAESRLELVVAEIPHQLSFSSPVFRRPFPDRWSVELRSGNFGSTALEMPGDEMVVYVSVRCGGEWNEDSRVEECADGGVGGFDALGWSKVRCGWSAIKM